VGVVTTWFLWLAILIVAHVLSLICAIICLRRLRREIAFLRVTTFETLLAELKARGRHPGAELR
jgi:hypothetical protein